MAQGPALQQISARLGFAPQHLYGVVQSVDNSYARIGIPKRRDPTVLRYLDIPNSELKGVQRAILGNILSPLPISDHVHSYVKSRSVVGAAKEICGKGSVLKVDIEDFFPSISSGRVAGIFRKLGFDDGQTRILTALTTYRGRLVQGAPTSPFLSNLILTKLDKTLGRMAATWELKYIRYSDDLFFYHRKNFNYVKFLNRLRTLVSEHGFKLNEQKTHYFPTGHPRYTLGLLTHGHALALPKTTRKRMRSAFHRASRQIDWGRNNFARLKGDLEWYRLVYGKTQTYQRYDSTLRTIERLKFHETYVSE